MSATEVNRPGLSVQTAQWLQTLQFRLSRTMGGEYRFSHVHWNGGASVVLRDMYLQNLLTGRSIDEVLMALSPAVLASRKTGLDGVAGDELRAYFEALARDLDLQHHAHGSDYQGTGQVH